VSSRKRAEARDDARVVFLGGVGEVGRNMACLELDGRTLIIDCGLSFPHTEMPGIDLVLPDFQYLRSDPDRIQAIVLTHGHEDHIGAVPYLLREFGEFLSEPLPIFGTSFTLALLRNKLEEHKVSGYADLRVVEAGGAASSGPFEMRFLQVTHSIPEGVAVAVDTPFGTVIHSGDFRLDQTPLDGKATDLQGFASEAARGVHLFMSDSTNSEDVGYIPSERTVGPVLRDIVAKAQRLVVVACFSSHIHRVQQAIDAAREAGRVVAFLGRSMHQSTGAARELEILDIDEKDVVMIEDVKKLDPRNVLIVSTGSQGEPLSALSLMAAHEHKWVKLVPEDTVVLSSSLIPGNEPAIHRVVDGLYRTGAEVYHMPSDPVHVSGHAASDELQFMLNLVRPRWFIPIHGERRHLSQHARLARDVGVPAERILVVEDGDTVDLGEDCRLGDRVPAGMTFVDGLGIGDVGEVVLRDRRKLSDDGIVVVTVAIDAHHGELVSGPEIVNKGFVHAESSGEILEEAAERVMLALEGTSADEVIDPGVLEQTIRKTLGKYFWEVTKRRPVIVPVIMEV